MPLRAQRSERCVSAVPPPGQSQRPVRDLNPSLQLDRLAYATPIRTGRSVHRAGVEPAQRSRAGYSRLGSPVPSRCITSVARVGVEPTAFGILRPDGLPVAYRAPFRPRCPGWESNPHSLGFKPSRSAGWRTRASRAVRNRTRPATDLESVRCSQHHSPVSVGARGIEPRRSCSQGTRSTVLLDAVSSGRRGRTFTAWVRARWPTG
jgi:hypothetical protein